MVRLLEHFLSAPSDIADERVDEVVVSLIVYSQHQGAHLHPGGQITTLQTLKLFPRPPYNICEAIWKAALPPVRAVPLAIGYLP
jgi:hypothetical protein